MNTKTVNSELVKKVIVSPGVKSFFFKPEEDFNYTAGQCAVFSFKHNNRNIPNILPFPILLQEKT